MSELSSEVTKFLDALDYPLRAEIEALRKIILQSDPRLSENIKWNGPNYSNQGEDRITMKIQPPKQIQLIFHRGAKKLTQPATPLIQDNSGLLNWRDNDRAIVSFADLNAIKKAQQHLSSIIVQWIQATAV